MKKPMPIKDYVRFLQPHIQCKSQKLNASFRMQEPQFEAIPTFSYCINLRNDAETETPVLWPPHVKSWLIGKDSDAGRDWGKEEKGTIKDEMAGWHHGLDGRESEWTQGDGDGQGGLACCNSWGRKEPDTTEQLNWTELPWWRASALLSTCHLCALLSTCHLWGW